MDVLALCEIVDSEPSRREYGGQIEMDALHFAAQEGHVDSVKVLLENGADLKAVTKDNKTALLDLARNLDVVKLLDISTIDITKSYSKRYQQELKNSMRM